TPAINLGMGISTMLFGMASTRSTRSAGLARSIVSIFGTDSTGFAASTGLTVSTGTTGLTDFAGSANFSPHFIQTATSRGFLYPQTSHTIRKALLGPVASFLGSSAAMTSKVGFCQDIFGSGRVISSTAGGAARSSLGAALPASIAKELGLGGEIK